MKKISILSILLIFSIATFSQNYTISGYIEDVTSGERIIGGVVLDADNSKYVTTTNEFGFFSLKVPKNKIKIQVIYIGYQTKELNLLLKNDTTLTINIEFQNEIDEVVVTQSYKDVESSQMSRIDIPISKIKNLPVIFGEVDLFKTLQLMPGVQSGTEGTSGIYVRGGGPDQNLILLDGVPVYNVSHMFGFFSVFNTAAIKNVTLFKGGFPARYGGRLSSVIDVQMKDGNMKNIASEVSIGLIASKFTIEGPIKKDKTSFIISARRTYIDLIAMPFIKMFGNEEYSGDAGSGQQYSYKDSFGGGYYFYDLNAKITHKLTDKDRLFFSFYGGKDKAYFKYKSEGEYGGYPNNEVNEFSLGWGNLISAARWNHSFKKNLFVNTTLTYSRFFFGVDFFQNYEDNNIDGKYMEEYNINYSSGIDDLAANVNFNWLPNVNHTIRFGASAIYHTFRPGLASFSINIEEPNMPINKTDTTFGSNQLYAPEFSIYAEDDFSITKRIKINYGARISLFNVRDTTFISPEPRISTRILLSKNVSLKASYAKMTQYLHFLSNNTVGLPIDLWMPATNIIVPEKSWQSAIGLSWLLNNQYSISVEGFYKKMDNIVEFKEGESIFSIPGEGGMGEVWEQKVTQGTGEAYGAEIFIQKKSGDFSGWVSYTLGWSNRSFENINFGQPFPYKYDRRHDISIVLMYNLNKNINFGLTWVYGSGTPVTLQKDEYGRYFGYNVFIYYSEDCTCEGYPYYGKRNNYRLPAYHRLDFSVNISKDKKRGRRTWSLGLYNAYNNINPFYTKFVNGRENFNNPEPNKTYLRLYSIFPVMPSFSYKFVWKKR